MNVAIFGEAEADEEFLFRIAAGAIGVERLTRVSMPLQLPARGFKSVLAFAPTAFKIITLRQEADGLIVAVDADKPPFHASSHDEPGGVDLACRLCALRASLRVARERTKPPPGRAPLLVAVGSPVPAIEAWYLVGTATPGYQQHLETACLRGEPKDYATLRRQLKELVYGTATPTSTQSRSAAAEHGARLAADLGILERHFPIGAGALLNDLRAWTAEERA